MPMNHATPLVDLALSIAAAVLALIGVLGTFANDYDLARAVGFQAGEVDFNLDSETRVSVKFYGTLLGYCNHAIDVNLTSGVTGALVNTVTCNYWIGGPDHLASCFSCGDRSNSSKGCSDFSDAPSLEQTCNNNENYGALLATGMVLGFVLLLIKIPMASVSIWLHVRCCKCCPTSFVLSAFVPLFYLLLGNFYAVFMYFNTDDWESFVRIVSGSMGNTDLVRVEYGPGYWCTIAATVLMAIDLPFSWMAHRERQNHTISPMRNYGREQASSAKRPAATKGNLPGAQLTGIAVARSEPPGPPPDARPAALPRAYGPVAAVAAPAA